MQVIFLVGGTGGGVITATWAQARMLCDAGVRVRYLAPRLRQPTIRARLLDSAPAGMEVRFGPAAWTAAMSTIARPPHGTVLMVAQYAMVWAYARLIARSTSAPPAIGQIHNSIAMNGALSLGWPYSSFIRQVHSGLLQSFERVIAVCDDLATQISAADTEVASRVRVCPNFVDTHDIIARAGQVSAADLGREPYVVSVGALNRQKNHLDSLLAFARYKRDRGAGNLVIIGDGPLRENLEARAAQLGIAESTVFMGYVGNPLPVIRNARALISTSIAEGFGIAIAEALVLDTPVIVYDCPVGPAELARGHADSTVVNVGDVHGIAEGIRLAMLPPSRIGSGRSVNSRQPGTLLARATNSSGLTDGLVSVVTGISKVR
jgi:glycosyltransferase involved in cell wall biosynthesis